jgi:hypothetical protein
MDTQNPLEQGFNDLRRLSASPSFQVIDGRFRRCCLSLEHALEPGAQISAIDGMSAQADPYVHI